jgi:SulP family sulfate permease
MQSFEVVGKWITGVNLYVTVGILVATMLIIHFLPKLTKVIPATLIAIIVMTLVTQFSPIKSVTVKDFVDTQKEFAVEKSIKTKEFNRIKGSLIVSQVDSKAAEIAASEIEATGHNENRKAGRFRIPDILISWEAFTIIFGLAITLAAIGNIVSGFFGSMGGCAMIGQSMINMSSGGRGRLSGISAAVFLLCFIVFPPLWKCIEMIPVAALIGVMFIVVIGTFEWTCLRLWNKIPKADFMIIVIVSAVTVLHDLAVAVATGVIISALIFAWRKSQQIHAVIKEEGGTKTYALKGPLFFGAIRTFQEIFTPSEDPDNVVIEFMNTRVYDHSALEAINGIAEKYRELGKTLHIKHLSKECQKLLKKAGDIVEVDIYRDPDYHIPTNQLD